MKRISAFLLVLVVASCLSEVRGAQDPKGERPNALEVSQALAQGDAFMAEKVYDKAVDAYRHADKISHHTCALCLLRIVSILRSVGDFDGALDTAKKAIAAAGDNKVLAAQSHLVRGALFTATASKPGDKKLREAEEEFRAALALDPGQSMGHRNLGIALIKENRDAEGIAELNLFIAAPGNGEKLVDEARRMVANPIRAREPFVPEFAFTSLEGASISNVSLEGKVVLLDFWATWCPPCRESVPTIQNLHKKYADKAFEIVGISADGDEDSWKAFVAKNKMNWAEYLDLSEMMLGKFEVDSFPTYIVVDKEGVVRYRQSGFGPATQTELEDTINKALKKPFVAAAVTKGTAPSVAAKASGAPASASGAGVAGTSKAAAVSTGSASAGGTTSGGMGASSVAPAVAVSAGGASGGMFHNGALGFSYPYPTGWTVASPEMVRNANAKMKELNAAAGHEEGPRPASAQLSELIFYAYGAGKDDGTFRAVPSIRITSLESFGAMLTPEVMTRNSGAQVNMGMKLVRGPEKFLVSDQVLYRMDFEDGRLPGHTWVSIVQTVVYDHVLTIEILAGSAVQLDLLASTVSYSVFANADK
jgi:thiol-disulfide isomerase/thioredoxin